MMRVVSVLGLLLALFMSEVSAADTSAFAALSVTAFGEQQFDIATGVTTLTGGGEVRDQKTKVRLTGSFIRFRDGVFIEAEGTQVEGSFGTLQADNISIDIPGGKLVAQGHLMLTRGSLEVSSGALTLFADADIVRFEGGVSGMGPSFTAATALLDVISGDVLLLGPYSFEAGPFHLTASNEGAMLELTYIELDEGPSYDAASEVSPDFLTRIRPFFP